MNWSSYISYVFPNEYVLQVIIYFIAFLAVVTLAVCIWLFYCARCNLELLREDNVNGLINIKPLELSLRQSHVFEVDAFDSYIAEKKESVVTKPLVDHLHAIYDAGRKSSRLDADLLVQNTIEKIFSGADSVKTFISLFLVFGILGTLFGLAISIGSFSGEGFVLNTEANRTASELSKLFGNLRGAFAPSIWGVFSTIVFVLIYTVGVQELCVNRLTKRLTTVTINIWLPALYPTDFQKGEISMAKLNDAVRNANETAQSHVQFGNKAQELLKNLDATNKTIDALRNIATVLDNSSNRYEAGSAKLAEMNDTLTGISSKMVAHNEVFNEYVNNQITAIRKLQDSYVANSDAIHKSLVEANKEYRETTGELKTIKEDVVNAVGMPINKELKQISDDLKLALNRVNDNLISVATYIEGFNNPMEESVDLINTLFNNTMREIENNTILIQNSMEDNLKRLKGISIDGGGNNVVNSDLDEKVEQIATCLEEIKKQNYKSVVSEQSGLGKYTTIGIAVLLFISIVIQGFIAYKLTTMEQLPRTVNNVMIKGENAGQ